MRKHIIARHRKEFFNERQRIGTSRFHYILDPPLEQLMTWDGVDLPVISFPRVTIRSLPEDVLLDIFDFFCQTNRFMLPQPQSWIVLVHVCRRWRSVVYASPHRLDLQLFCFSTTPVRKTLDVWPRFPIVVSNLDLQTRSRSNDLDNIFAALEHRDRVCQITIAPTSNDMLERLFIVMQEPFPALTHWVFSLRSVVWREPLPDTFMGGSVPHVKWVSLIGVPFPGLPKLLLSSLNLVNLQLLCIPDTGYISPEAMVRCLSTLTNLKSFEIGFKSPASYPDPRNHHPPPLTHVILPALTKLAFRGVSEYLEDFAARVDTPLLQVDQLDIRFFNQLVFEMPHFSYFIGRILKPKIPLLATISIRPNDAASIALGVAGDDHELRVNRSSIGVLSRDLDWQISSLSQICDHFSTLLDKVEQLDIRPSDPVLRQTKRLECDMDSAQWLEILQLFPAVRTLRISNDLVPLIVPALNELSGDMIVGVLPSLHDLFIGAFSSLEPLSSPWAIEKEQFITARQLANRPVTVHTWMIPLLPPIISLDM
jgi:F-box-like